jgi:hypothetical protein
VRCIDIFRCSRMLTMLLVTFTGSHTVRFTPCLRTFITETADFNIGTVIANFMINMHVLQNCYLEGGSNRI